MFRELRKHLQTILNIVKISVQSFIWFERRVIFHNRTILHENIIMNKYHSFHILVMEIKINMVVKNKIILLVIIINIVIDVNLT